MRLPTVMGHKFSEVPRAEIQRSRFDRSFGYKTTFDAGWLVPFYVDDVLPGDTFVMKTEFFGRLATPLKPVMDNMYFETFFFFVPYRLIWDNWERFQGAQDDPTDSTDFTIPQVTIEDAGAVVGTLEDYMGLPLGADTAGDYAVSALPFRAYNLIWNEWFRDQNLQNSVLVNRDDGPDDIDETVILRRGKRPDYFTSCLPRPQKGDSVLLPLGAEAPVTTASAIGQAPSVFIEGAPGSYQEMETAGGAGDPVLIAANIGVEAQRLYADLSEASAASINELRQAFQVQRILERDARGGTRYIEAIKARFGVTSPDARLQRPEYLGGGSSRVNVTPVPQTSATDIGTDVTAQGNLAGFGTVSGSGHGFTTSFTEHGVVLGLMCVRADLTYQQGIERHWSRLTRYDFFEPALAHLGEQVVFNREIFATGGANDSQPFGYQERFAEYRYKPSKITGLFRSTQATTLDVWHLSQEFSALPTLGPTFIQEDPPVDRVIAVSTEPHFIIDMYCRLTAARPMPLFGVPGLIDHF